MDQPRSLEAALDAVYEQTYGPLAQEARDEDARHLEALRTIPTLYTTGVQLAFQRAMETADPADMESGFTVHAELADLEGGEDEALRRAMEAEHARHRAAVADLECRAAALKAAPPRGEEPGATSSSPSPRA